jgi:hypothetical protein
MFRAPRLSFHEAAEFRERGGLALQTLFTHQENATLPVDRDPFALRLMRGRE